jgi:hypothetical protein
VDILPVCSSLEGVHLKVFTLIRVDYFDRESSNLKTLGWVAEFDYPKGSKRSVFVVDGTTYYKLLTWGDESGISMATGLPRPKDVILSLCEASDEFLLERTTWAEREALCALYKLASRVSEEAIKDAFIKALRHSDQAVSAYAEVILTDLAQKGDDKVKLALERFWIRRLHDRYNHKEVAKRARKG